MKALLVLLLLSGCATPATGTQITVPNAKVAECQAQGGCGLMSRDQILALMAQARDEGAAQVMQGLDSHGCRRGRT